MADEKALDYRLEDLIDIPLFQALQDKLNEIYSFPSAIIDNEGNILTATAWQDICTKFHRVHPQSEIECKLSDQYILEHISEANPAVSYRCPHGMVDNATPIIIDGRHLGNFFTGQLFLQEPDLDFFRGQAKKYGFDEQAYLEAVKRVPVWSQHKLDLYLDFIKTFVEILAKIGYKNLQEIEVRKRITESERKYRYLAENIRDVIWVIDAESMRLQYVSPSVEKLSGFTAEEMLTMPVEKILSAEMGSQYRELQRRRLEDFLAQKVAQDHYFIDELQHARKDGSTVWTEMVSSYGVNPETGKVEIRGVTRDISERKRLEIEREALLEITRGLISTKDLKEYLALVHQTLKKVIYAENFSVILKNKKTGLFEEVYAVDEYDEPMPPSKLEKSLSAYVFKTAEPLLLTDELFHELEQRGEVMLVGTDSPSWLGVPLVSANGAIGVMTVQDYHTPQRYSEEDKQFFASIASQVALAVEQRQAEDALRQSEEKFSKAFHISPDSININRLSDGLYLAINEGYTALTGYTPEDVLGKTSLEINIWVNPEDRARLVKGLREKGEVSNLEAVFRMKDGSTKTALMSARVIDFNGELCILSITRDITDRILAEREKEELQQQLLQAQKMESVGRLAGGVAHDFNNLLGVIMGHAETALAKSSPDDPAYHDLQEILKAAERSAGLTRQLLAFARKQTITPRVMNLNSTLSSLLEMFQRLIGEHITLVWKPSPDLWLVKLDPSQVDQILANLLVNARDAIRGHGTITIETHNLITEEPLSSSCPAGEYVTLTVSDDGMGMDEETLAHLFEPFYTTKETGKGTGLGLATVYGIVQQNHGFIKIESELGKGSQVVIHFPRATEEIAESPMEYDREIRRGASEVVLVVEDEPALLELVCEALEDAGYRVLTANSPVEALRLSEAHLGEIDLLVTDVVMPGMNGRMLSEKLASHQPRLKSLFMSGYTDDIIAEQGVLSEDIFFIQKPFLLEDLCKKVHEVLGRSS